MSEYRDTISLYTDIAYDIVQDVVIRYPYIPILRAFFLRYLLVFFDIVVDNTRYRVARKVDLECPNIGLQYRVQS